MLKRVLIVLGVVILAALLYLANGYRNLRLQSEAADRIRVEKEATFYTQLAEYQHAVPLGTRRSEVVTYLESRNLHYGENRGEIKITLGDEPSVFPCDRWTMYVSFEFTQAQADPTPRDALRSISLKRMGHCL